MTKCFDILEELQKDCSVNPLNENEVLLNRARSLIKRFMETYPPMRNEDADQVSFIFQFIGIKSNCKLVEKIIDDAEEFLKYGR